MLFAGIDVGSTGLKRAVLDKYGRIVKVYPYVRHLGNIEKEVQQGVDEVLGDFEEIHITFTGKVGENIAKRNGLDHENEVLCVFTSLQKFMSEMGTIIDIGGQDAKIIPVIREDGAMRIGSDVRMNSSCAGGTGSFMDQQAERLYGEQADRQGIYEPKLRVDFVLQEFIKGAASSTDPVRIAGRCSVFAKSDMIHNQQAGKTPEEISHGLILGFARNFYGTIALGMPLREPVALIGGVAGNPVVKTALEKEFKLGTKITVPEHFASVAAIGAALRTIEGGIPRQRDKPGPIHLKFERDEEISLLQPLEIKLSKIGSNNVREAVDPSRTTVVYIGIDVGSVSTNVVVIDDRTEEVLARYYGRTMGRPFDAVKAGLKDVYSVIGSHSRVLGVGTTGSGRKLAGVLVGADVIRNEITAHAMGVYKVDPEIDTVFEIGGQDSKYISLQNGVPVDFEMNKVCAAGTGSFLEEQGGRLNVNIKEQFAGLAFQSRKPVRLGDRCTVFMESAVATEQQKGTNVKDILAGLAYSTVFNYLNKVVGKRKIGKKISFQGGTALNEAVIAAFEIVLGKPIIAPDHRDVLGALGVALYAKQARENGEYDKSMFRGIEQLLGAKYEFLAPIRCKDCGNRCEIQQIKINYKDSGSEIVPWGGHCGKYESQGHVKKKFPPNYLRIEESFVNKELGKINVDHPKGTVAVPLALQNYFLAPLWKAFFAELGYRVLFSEKTNNQIIGMGIEATKAEYCFPVKIFHGAFKSLLEKEFDFLFIPSVVDSDNDSCPDNSFFCNYIAAEPFYLNASFDFSSLRRKVLTPTISLRDQDVAIIESLYAVLKDLGISKIQISKAFKKARAVESRIEDTLRKYGEKSLSDLKDEEPAVVLIGRPYNLHDEVINFGIARIFQKNGIKALPMNFIDIRKVSIPEYPSMYWHYGNLVLRTVKAISRKKNLYPVLLSNFKCGPDSYIAHFVKDIMGEKPYLELEFDEHSGEAGVETRVEAFVDSIRNILKQKLFYDKKIVRGQVTSIIDRGGRRTLYLPHMSRGPVLLSAAFKAFGIKSVPLESILKSGSPQVLELGLRHTSGKECFPATVTLGDILYAIKQLEGKGVNVRQETAFFMPEAHGPCRFGQYNKYIRIVLDELGYNEIPLVSLSSKDSYRGLGGLSEHEKREFRKLGWKAIVLSDYLEKLLRAHRPYEIHKGDTERTFIKAQELMSEAIESYHKGSRSQARAALGARWSKAVAMFKKIPVKKQKRPLVAITGEIYVRSHDAANQGLELQIEELGGECYVAPVAEWIMYTTYMKKWQAVNSLKVKGLKYALKNIKVTIEDIKTWIKFSLDAYYQSAQEHRLFEPLADFIPHQKDTPVDTILDLAAEYGLFKQELYGEAILTLGGMIDYAKRNFDAIVTSMPFGCMPGTNVDAISPLVKRTIRRVTGREVPILNIVNDETKQPNRELQIRVLIEQTRQNGKNSRSSQGTDN
ncbi:MAG: hypothetical protein CVU57_00205 [Deltaproteobacteria bacterium HGW-Deltaproteobacteria-15]|jgi:predicted CoA-substrate-specific enzyme activase|nr:MAG: hypothetical protein CVU57_00205 [Deltaproteobacteria bacterium HGW-Deltaproteobacteria-15]